MKTTHSLYRYAVIITSKEARNAHGTVVTRAGDKFLLCEDWDGWVSGTGYHYREEITTDAKLFDTVDEAETFVRSWEPHPWYVKPEQLKIVPVKPVYEKRIIGYDRA